MLSRLILSAALLIACGAAHAQGTASPKTSTKAPAAPAAPAMTPAQAAALDAYLKRWEDEMRKVQTLSAGLTRIDKDPSFGSTTKLTGAAHYMKAGSGTSVLNLAILELKIDGKTEIAEKFVCTGTYLYQWMPAQKEIKVIELPRPKPGQVSEDNFLGFLFGMRAEEAKRRYVLNMTREDKYYIYVDITPRFAADRAEFQRAQLVLNKDNFLPRRLWFEHPNHTEVTWDIPALKTGVVLDRRAFDAPRAPAGWKLVPVSRPPAPRVIRTNGK
jgi:TIGR03009 family protein